MFTEHFLVIEVHWSNRWLSVEIPEDSRRDPFQTPDPVYRTGADLKQV